MKAFLFKNRLLPVEFSIRQNSISLVLWALILIYLVLVVCFTHSPSTVTQDYYTAGQHWLRGLPLYDGSGWKFIYLPQSACFYAALSWMPFIISEIIWRVILVLLLITSFAHFTQLMPQKQKTLFFWLTMMSVIMGSAVLKLGQMNLTVLALTLLAIVSLKHQNFWWAAGLLALNFALKLTCLPFLIVLALFYRRMIVPLIVCLVVVTLVPFLLQHPSYVWQQYVGCIKNFHLLIHITDNTHWAQLFNLIYVFSGWVMPKWIGYLTRGAAALAVLFICNHAYQHTNKSIRLVYIFTIVACYLVLFNPRSENNEYFIVIPSIVFFAIYYYHSHFKTAISYMIYLFLMASNYQVSQWLHYSQNIVLPLATTLFTAQLLWHLYRDNNYNHNS